MKSDRDLKIKWQTSEYELLVPANNKDVAIKAIKAGADAVYIGYVKYGARIQAGNSMEDIMELIDFAHKYRVKVYITINTILKNEELKDIENLIWKLYQLRVDGIIIQDMGILECKLPPISIIASTQCHNNTLEKIKFLEETGFQRVILPREISLDEIKQINKNTDIELECFIHGALCVSYSGQCYLSRSIGQRSANRGECAQPCRRLYSLKDADGKYIIKDKYILSLKDLNLSNYLEDLINSGVTSFKIEGRLKNISYVINTTAYYRRAIDKILNNYGLKRSSQGKSYIDFEPDLNKSFNRGFTDFNITGEKHNVATVDYNKSIGEFIGVVQNVKKDYFMLNSNVLNNGDGICFFDINNMLQGTNINSVDGQKVFPASIKGIKAGTEIYRNFDKEFEDKLNNSQISRKIPISFKLRELSFGYMFILTDEEKNSAVYLSRKNYEKALNEQKALETIKVQMSKLGNTEFEIDFNDIKIKHIPFIKVSEINQIRRELALKLSNIRQKNYRCKYRTQSVKVVDYPIKKLDYKANIYNDKAKSFYKKRGAIVYEPAFEAQNNPKDKILMTSKYCIKNQLGLCPKYNKIPKYKEPFTLINENNKAYLVDFRCLGCIMNIKEKD